MERYFLWSVTVKAHLQLRDACEVLLKKPASNLRSTALVAYPVQFMLFTVFVSYWQWLTGNGGMVVQFQSVLRGPDGKKWRGDDERGFVVATVHFDGLSNT